jgi:hypothetical protein
MATANVETSLDDTTWSYGDINDWHGESNTTSNQPTIALLGTFIAGTLRLLKKRDSAPPFKPHVAAPRPAKHNLDTVTRQ